MRRARWGLLLGGAWLLGCEAHAPRPAVPAAPPAAWEALESGTVGNLDGVRVPVGGCWEGAYATPGDRAAQGYGCTLYPPEGEVRVGAGSVFLAGGKPWRVLEVVQDGGIGEVRVQPE